MSLIDFSGKVALVTGAFGRGLRTCSPAISRT